MKRRGTSIFDDVNYKFQIENVQNRQVLQSYAPEYYLEMFPDMQQRVLFLKGRDVFKRWWKKTLQIVSGDVANAV